MKNSDIAKVMGWDYKLPETKYLFAADSMRLAKLLQAKMVSDKHMIKIMNNWDGEYMAEDVLSCKNSIMSEWCKTEQEAIVSLFKKVYGGGR